MFTELHLARRYLFRGRAKHISFIGVVSCTGIALGIATLIVVISVMNGFDRELTDRLMRFNYHLTVEAADNSRLYDIENIIQEWPEVKASSIFLETQIFGKFDKIIFPLAVKGIDFENSKEKENFYKYVGEEYSRKGFFIGEGLRHRFFIADAIEYYPLDKKLQLQQSPVRGVFRIGSYDADNNYLITSIREAMELSPNYLLFLGITIDNMFSADNIKNKILNTFGQGVFVTTWIEANRVLFSALKLEKLTMFIILSLIILVASFSVFATLTVKVVEKTKDIGILKSLGFTNRNILAIFSLQGVILGVIGTLTGVILGFGVCFLLDKYHFIRLPEDIYYIDYLPVALNYGDIFLIAAIGIFLSYFFSLFPAMRAAKLSPSEALRYE